MCSAAGRKLFPNFSAMSVSQNYFYQMQCTVIVPRWSCPHTNAGVLSVLLKQGVLLWLVRLSGRKDNQISTFGEVCCFLSCSSRNRGETGMTLQSGFLNWSTLLTFIVSNGIGRLERKILVWTTLLYMWMQTTL